MVNMTSLRQPVRVVVPDAQALNLPTKSPFLLQTFRGDEEISRPFVFQLTLLADNRIADMFSMDGLLGRPIAVRVSLRTGLRRYFHGMCRLIEQGARDMTFTAYTLELVPHFWFWTRRRQSRIFQHLSVPEILKEVLKGLDVDATGIQGTFHPLDYCVQYRESDFDFASRLMEEAGIYYFFKHAADGHKMVLANTPRSHPDLPELGKDVFYEPMVADAVMSDKVHQWTKRQQACSSSFALWDHHFERPRDHLAFNETIKPADVTVGKVSHKLKFHGSHDLEAYDYPGDYTSYYGSVGKGGEERPKNLPYLNDDGQQTVTTRMEEEAVGALVIEGTGTCRHFVTGHQFILHRHFSGAGGPYVLTRVHHELQQSGDFRAGKMLEFHYQNRFTCIPQAIPFRPARVTPRPVIQGTQTAIVVGPPDSEVYCDKYGRIKVQFHWDRKGKYNLDSSCWVRVAQVWAGNRWGATFIPRVGQEVVVAFEEGDPDRPLVVGCVYNFDQMPPYLGQGPDGSHAHDARVSGIKTNSTLNGKGFNELRFDDNAGREQFFLHAQNNFDQRVKNDTKEHVEGNKHVIVGLDNVLLNMLSSAAGLLQGMPGALDAIKSGNPMGALQEAAGVLQMAQSLGNPQSMRDMMQNTADQLDGLASSLDPRPALQQAENAIKAVARGDVTGGLPVAAAGVELAQKATEAVDKLKSGASGLRDILQSGGSPLDMLKKGTDLLNDLLQKGGNLRELILRNSHRHVKHDQLERISGSLKLTIGKEPPGPDTPPPPSGNSGAGLVDTLPQSNAGDLDLVVLRHHRQRVEGQEHSHVKKDRKEKIDGSTSLTVGKDQQEKVGEKHALDAGKEIHLKAGDKVVIEGGTYLTLKAKGGYIEIGPDGINIKGTLVRINSQCPPAQSGSGSDPKPPEDAVEAQPDRPLMADNARTGNKSALS